LKVREVLGNPSSVAGMSGKEERKVPGSIEASFQGQLKHVENGNHELRLRELADKITMQGEKLGKKVDIRELKIYKKMISDFLDEAISNSHKFSKQSFLDRRGRHKVYAVVKQVNNEIDLLTKDVLSEEKDNIGILKRLDDIRGLIMDIIL